MKRKQARGGFFAALKTELYQPQGILLGQENNDSCVAACCRMLLLDQLPKAGHDLFYAESYLRAGFETDADGSTIALIPAVLREFGASEQYVYRQAMTEMELRRVVKLHPLVALVPAKRDANYHALIVDKIESEMVAIRDPLPTGQGTAYRLALNMFLTRWFDRKEKYGLAVTVLE